MSNIVWDQDKGWHDGPEVKVTAEAGRIKVMLCCCCDAPATRNLESHDVACRVHYFAHYGDES